MDESITVSEPSEKPAEGSIAFDQSTGKPYKFHNGKWEGLPTFRQKLIRCLQNIAVKSCGIQEAADSGVVRATCAFEFAISDEELVEWLTDNHFEEGGRVENLLADVQKNLDELRELLAEYKEGEKNLPF